MMDKCGFHLNNYLYVEALMRFMKAKLRVLQEEVDRLSAENISKVRREREREREREFHVNIIIP